MSSKCKQVLEPANDDTIQCWFFSPKLGSDLSLWEDLCQQLNNSIKTITKDYIWHRDEFQIYTPIIEDSITGKCTYIWISYLYLYNDSLNDVFDVNVLNSFSKMIRHMGLGHEVILM